MTTAQAQTRSLPAHEQTVRYVKGVGPHRLAQLRQLGIVSVEDACYFPPMRYEDRTSLLPIGSLRPGQTVAVRGRLTNRSLRRARRGLAILEAVLSDGTGELHGVWFNQPYLADQLVIDQEWIWYGTVEARPRLQMAHPELERVEGEEAASVHMGRIVPVYPLIAGIGQRWLRQIIYATVQQYADALEDPLPEAVRRSRGLPLLAQAVRDLHFPGAWEVMELAQQRLAFDELFLFQAALAQRQARSASQSKPHRYVLDGPLITGLRQRLPFALTAGQQQVLQELLSDMSRSFPMHRLLQGDVGCGKTIVMIILMAVAVQSGHQAALMAPTELLAEQHARTLRHLLDPLGVSVAVLSQGVPPPERKRIMAEIASGAVHIVLGTHALIQTAVTFKNLTLVIVDEQHKFGVVQRAHLAKKAKVPDVLVVTATPIPRTLALSIYGDLDLSTIAELPGGRKPITTLWMPEAERPQLYELIRRELAAGRQGYVVYPLVETSETKDLKAATQMAKQLQADIFPEFKVGLLHGQMAARTKDQVMRAFAKGEIHLLVSTVIVEVGLDVPNATVMVVEHPERFGLAQLHQLRGRIGRGAHASTCIVVSNASEERVRDRLNAFTKSADGFELAEKDLELRGPGELLGRRQHGWLRFRIANLGRDKELLEAARDEARLLIHRDPDLSDPALAALKQRLQRIREHAA